MWGFSLQLKATEAAYIQCHNCWSPLYVLFPVSIRILKSYPEISLLKLQTIFVKACVDRLLISCKQRLVRKGTK